MIVAVGADHAGFELKGEMISWMESNGHQVKDLGAYEMDTDDDYPDFAAAVAGSVCAGEAERGVVICGSGVGASIAANKVKGIRACLCHDTYTAHQGVEHDGMNVVCIGGRVIGIETAKAVLESFLGASFMPEERFQRRLDKIIQLEQNGLG
ncbi:MAG: ribose 5-phosphate isomerase B [Chloroflexi bacterium]|nr:ribose 5-phosphate isomerase B [Chloroflexota bacterium]MDA1269690.1 ribose 5-phosphate isomerase B [Chloroflexota bacterium]PKB58079.1 MAG: ribose 5-phosphate isomerase B [SAR202 cluster bacterium Casp-Chloro-G2]